MKRLMAIAMIITFFAGCGQPDKAAEVKQPAVTKTDYEAQGFDALKKGDVVAAIKYFDESIRQDPQNPERYITLAQVYFQLKYYPGAITTLHGALKVDPMNAQAYYLLAASYHLQNLPEDRLKAIEAAKRSMQISLLKKDRESFEKARDMYIALVPGGDELPEMEPEPEPQNEQESQAE
jgi:Tfp pilus assembly protein PilF